VKGGQEGGASVPDLLLGLLALLVIAGVGLVLHRGNDAPPSEALADAPSSPAAGASSPAAPAIPLVPFVRSATGATKVLFVGDAVSVGADATARSKDFVQLTIAGLRASGAIHDHEDASSPARIASRRAFPSGVALVVVELGTNDAGVQASEAETAYGALLDQIRNASPKTAVVCMGTWHTTAPDLDAAIERSCTVRGGLYLPLSDYASDPALQAAKGEATFLGVAAGPLPNDLGHQRIAARLLRAIASLQR
jgi:hypothetical protein